jgi:hypothetical protein
MTAYLDPWELTTQTAFVHRPVKPIIILTAEELDRMARDFREHPEWFKRER